MGYAQSTEQWDRQPVAPEAAVPRGGRRRAPTLWEEGRQPGRQVVLVAAVTALAVVGLDLALTGAITLLFDVAFVLICLAAVLSVRPRDFFGVGVLPPLLMLSTVLILAVAARGAIADPGDGLIQAVVSGLAHHAGALVVGYGLTLGILAVRQVVASNRGASSRGMGSRRRSVRMG